MAIEPVRQERAAVRVPPHNIEAEASLLGALLLSRDAIVSAIEERVDAADFYKPAHGHVFDAIMSLYSQGEAVDPITVSEELRRAGLLDALGGKGALLGLQASTPASANAGHYAKIVTELSLLRRLINVAGEIAELGYALPDDVTETLDRAESMVFEVAERRVSDSLVGLHASLQATLDDLEQMYGRDGHVTGVATGYHDLDDLLLGLHGSQLIVVAARPAMGKTAFALGAAAHVAMESRKPVMLFSMEMGHLELTKRMLAAEARVDARRLQTGNIPEDDWQRLSHAVGRLAEAPLYIDDNAHCTVMEMRAKARRVKAKHGDLGLIVVDYLQLMTGSGRSESRQVEVSEMSRGLKILARELDCPVITLSQLNRQLEYRQDKRPMLADLRESGCLTADTRVWRADTNERVSMGELLERGERNIPVWSLDEHLKLVARTMTHVFSSGTKETFELRLGSGRSVKGSANHPFLTVEGWKPLEHLAAGDSIAVARRIDGGTRDAAAWSRDRLALFAHLIGDGCTLPRHSPQYTTTDPENAEFVAGAAQREFAVAPRITRERTWLQVFLASQEPLTQGRRNPIAAWLDGLGSFGLRAWEKRLPESIFGLGRDDIAWFLRHLWATDGSVYVGKRATRVYYATTSEALARDVADLLLRVDIRARVRRVWNDHARDGFVVDVSGAPDQLRFAREIGVHGARGAKCDELISYFDGKRSNPNVDRVPAAIWEYVRYKVMPEIGVSARELARRLQMQYCGSSLYKSGLSRERMRRLADALPDPYLQDLAASDVLWDEIVEIVPLGEQPVYDATVEGTHNFLANGIVAHNSIEQDADVVLFLYRDEVYNEESEQRGIAEVIVSKHRNGPTGSVRLAFLDSYTKFANMARE
ncbi:MAG: replicative DNA helicase [Acidimicrobiia bacterium]